MTEFKPTAHEAGRDTTPPPYIVPHSQQAIPILYEDSDLLIVDKPHLLLSVPGRHPINRDSLISRLSIRYPGVTAVHRLDLDTSGLLVVPRTREALSEISRHFQARRVSKEYTALVWGQVADDQGEIDLAIARDWINRPKQKICSDTGKPSLTRYQVLARNPKHTLLRLIPVTGRSHQLRIHLREIGHPILGCDMYAHPQALRAAPRLMLHATRLGFTHPRLGDWLQAVSPPPFTVDGLSTIPHRHTD